MILGVGSFAHSIGQALADDRGEGLDLSHPQLRPFPAVAGRADFFAHTPFPARFRCSRKTGLRSSSRSPLTGRCNPGRRICCNRALAFSAPRARRCASSASGILPGNCARISKFPFRRLTSRPIKRPPKKSWRNIRGRLSSKIRSARRPARFTRFYARRSRTRGPGCGMSIMPRAFSCRNTWAAPRSGTSCW